MTNVEIQGEIFPGGPSGNPEDGYGWDKVAAAISGETEEVVININSPGGDVISGLTVVNAIQNTAARVTARVSVIAASMAAVIALACDEVVVDENSVIMLHNCWSIASGNKEEMQSAVDAMGKIDAIQRNIIAAHCRDIEKISEAMDKGDLWMTADELAAEFDNVIVKKADRSANSIAAVGSLSLLVLKAKENADDEKADSDEKDDGKPADEDKNDEQEGDEPNDEGQDDEKQDEPDEKEEPKAYALPPSLKALMNDVDQVLEA